MKKHFVAVLLSLLYMEAIADPVTLAQARKIAAAYMPSVAHSPALVRGIAADGNQKQNLYVFSRGENQGYVIVSGNDALPAVIGFTESGDFDEDNLPPALQQMMDYYAVAADSLNAMPQGSVPRRALLKASGTRDIQPLMTTHWHQSSPYNDQAPFLKGTTNRAVTGCVATAASQIIYYWHRDLGNRTKYTTPTYGYGDAPVTDQIPSGTPLKWHLMQDSYSGGEPAETRSAVATLMAVVGRSGWLTYGSSTAGQIDEQRKNVLGGQFGLNAGNTVWRDGYSQTSWEKMIVQDLEEGRPILYTGVHATQGGHAVVLDGYRKNDNLFHFNFGWGGQGDGYYTVDAATGMNNFNESQGMVWNIYAKKPNMTGRLFMDSDTLMTRVANKFTARITNNGTLPQQGFYVYVLSGTQTPSSTAVKPAKDEETIIGIDQSAVLEFEYSPTSTNTYTIYLTDKEKNILDKVTNVPCVASVATLTLHQLTVDGQLSAETVATEDDEAQVHYVYGTNAADITAKFTNAATATLCAPRVSSTLYALENEVFVEKSTKTKQNVTFRSGETADMVFDYTKLDQDVIYKFEIDSTASTTRKHDITFEVPSAVYFKLKNETLAASPSTDGFTLTFTGEYNAQAFEALAQVDSIACYDLRQVKGVREPLVAANPNALFYVNAESGLSGTNVVVDGVCQQLILTPGYNFLPLGDFHAMQAIYHASHAIGRFATTVLPFDAATPRGMMARRVTNFRSTGVSEADSCNLQMYAGTPYVILTGMPVNIEAQGVDVSITRASQASEILVATYKNQTATANQLLLDDSDNQYFNIQTGANIPALTAYAIGERKLRLSSTSTLSKDGRAKELAQSIADACDVLESNAYAASLSAQQSFQAVIDEAADTLRTQPIAALQNEQINRLDSATTAYLYSAASALQPDGQLDCTYLIQNPSYETGSMKGWSVKSSVINKIASSLANYVSGASGECVARVNLGGEMIQEISGVENGTYTLSVDFAADYDQQIQLAANGDTITQASTDFGPMYMSTVTLEGIKVTDGTLCISACGVDSWVKLDNWRLIQTEGLSVGIIPTIADPAAGLLRKGVYDLQGRRLNAVPQRGAYIMDGKIYLK